MSKHTRPTLVTFAAGVLLVSLSACSTSPINPDSPLGHATEKMAEVGSQLWVKTKHVFRADGTGSDAKPHSDLAVAARSANEAPEGYMDEVDLALVQDEPVDRLNNDIIVTTTIDSGDAEILEIEQSELIADATSIEPVVMEQTAAQVMGDYEHVVQDNETLWILSKQLTGDATNWRILAELNGLDENGSVFPGQKLHIPADLATGRGIPTVAAAKPVTNGSTVSPQAATANRLAIPQADTSAVEIVTEIAIADNAPVVPVKQVATTAFEVQAGETMWDLAKRTTGDATNWKAIAAANAMSDKEAAFIKYGQSIGIPTDLLKTSGATGINVANAKPAAEQITSEAPVVNTDTQIVTEVVTQKPVEGDVKIMPANFTAEPPVIDEMKPADNGLQVEPQSQAVEGGNGESVMVSGTYYPKAVYNDANFSAPLLTRVSPGTKLLVVRAIGPWFEVKTEHGIGYVHSRDIK